LAGTAPSVLRVDFACNETILTDQGSDGALPSKPGLWTTLQ
jgi:hypothetical protein